ncbi:MAG: hypothetical protein K0V04_32755 [Deltaproteobacteria bacterium]|nr:hypothetical protein [Deltaproteobacteria bacterium]
MRSEARVQCPADDPDACDCPEGADACTLTFEEQIGSSTVDLEATMTHPGSGVELVFE